ncbi:unnamed protein product [Heterobilharzia americana]|nr:unnamed protein product [Heterobilharzia americana]
MNVHFLFNKKFYRQSDGVTMGSPLGPILANVFLAELENGSLESIISGLELYCRYVGDTFLIVNNENGARIILDKFNSVYPVITFTIETESDDRITFLDV